MIGNYLLKGFAFITVPIFARLLTTAEFGIFSTFVTYENIFFVIIGAALHSSYKNALYKYGTDKEGDVDYFAYTSNTMVFLGISAAVWVLLFAFLSGPLGDLFGLKPEAVVLVALFSFGSSALQCYNADRGLRYEYASYLKAAAFNALTNFALSLLLIYTIFGEERAMARILGTTIPRVIIGFGVMITFFRRSRPKKVRETLSWGLKYSLPIVPHGLSQIILNQFDRVMIKKMIGDAAAGQYSFAYTIYSIISVTFSSLDTVWTPWFYEKMNQKDYAVIRKNSKAYAFFIFLFCAAVLLASPELIWILGGAKYEESVHCVLPIVTGGYFLYLYYFPAGIEYFYEKTKFIAIGSMAAAVINIVLNYIFIQKYGYVAAAYTTLVCYILYFCFHYVISYRIFGGELFSTKVLAGLGGALVLVMFGVELILELMILRWILLAGVMVFLLWGSEKEFGVVSKVKQRIGGKG